VIGLYLAVVTVTFATFRRRAKTVPYNQHAL